MFKYLMLIGLTTIDFFQTANYQKSNKSLVVK